MKRACCVLALLLTLISADAAAWGDAGHRAVGAIASRLIEGTRARQQLDTLLLPGETLESIATWADCVKSSYCGPETAEMRAFTAANPQHRSYHYTDIPFQNGHYRDGAAGSGRHDIVQTLKQAVAVLQGRDNGATNPHHFSRRQALLLIVHLSGDIHQPLHVGAAYVGKDGGFVVPATRARIDGVNIFDTRGGNSLLPDLAGPEPDPQASGAAIKSLHTYWDIVTVDDAMRRSAAHTPQQFARIVTGEAAPPADTGEPAGWPDLWADDTLRAAKLAFAGLAPGAMGEQRDRRGEPYPVWALSLPRDYAEASAALARAQLIKAGYRLAALLQAIWP